MKLREAGVKESMAPRRTPPRRGEKDAAITQFKAVLDQKCLFPK